MTTENTTPRPRPRPIQPVYHCTPFRHSTPLEVCHVCGSPNTWVARWLDHVIAEFDTPAFHQAWGAAAAPQALHGLALD
jgi:hypothetical protein